MKQAFATVDKFIFATFTLVIALAYPTWNSLVGPLEQPALQKVAKFSGLQASRSVASIPSTFEPKVSQTSHENSFDLYCGKSLKEASFQIQGEYIQLHGSNCWANKASDGVEIENTSNGYSATVFQQSPSKYKTDLIQLRQGMNQIKIRFRAVTGQLLEQQLNVLAK